MVLKRNAKAKAAREEMGSLIAEASGGSERGGSASVREAAAKVVSSCHANVRAGGPTQVCSF